MLLDPLFLVYWLQAAASFSTMRHNYVHVFRHAMDAWLFFVNLDVLLAYLVFTGVGVWKRIGTGNPRDGYPPRRCDVVLTSAACAISVFMLGVGLISVTSNRGYGAILVGTASATLVFVVIDVRTWFRGGQHIKHWWAIHAWKLSVAWVALVYAVFLRWRAKSTVLESLTAELLLILLAALVVVIGLYSARLHRSGRLARLLHRIEHPSLGDHEH